MGTWPRFARGSYCEISCTAAVDRLMSCTLESVMQNKDLLWVRPDYAAGKIAPESPTQKSSEKQPQPFVDDGTLDTFTVAQIPPCGNTPRIRFNAGLKMNRASKLAVTRIHGASANG